MLAFDGWKNVVCQNLLGSVLFTSDNKMIIQKIEDISEKRCTGDIVMNSVGNWTIGLIGLIEYWTYYTNSNKSI